MACLDSSACGRPRSRDVLANGPSRCPMTARCASKRETVLLELEQRVVAEEATDGAPHHPFHASEQGGHVVAPVAAGPTPACPPLVAMPITQAPDPAPHELANRAPAWIVVNIHDRVRHHRSSSR